jgi:hypothetical protein
LRSEVILKRNMKELPQNVNIDRFVSMFIVNQRVLND